MLNKNSPPWRAEIATRVPIWHVAMQHFRTLPAQGPKTTSVPFMLCPVDRVAMRPGGGALMRRIGLAAMGSILIAPAAGRAAEFQPYAEGKLQYDGNLFRTATGVATPAGQSATDWSYTDRKSTRLKSSPQCA